jgi:four helix bundle protein
MGNFQKLRVWQNAKDLSVKIYKLTQNLQFKRDFGFRDQIQRAAVSIPSNIAEGDESGTNKSSVRYFYIAKGSIAELMTQLIIANEINYIDSETKNFLIDDCDKISSMLNKLIKARCQSIEASYRIPQAACHMP